MRISRAATFQTCSIGLREPGTEDGTFIAIAVNFLKTGWEELGECRMTTGRKEGAGQDRVGLRKAHRNRDKWVGQDGGMQTRLWRICRACFFSLP